MATFYAWSEIRGSKDGKAVTVKTGDKVSAGDLDLTDEQFQELVDSGSVREQKYPEELLAGSSDLSPTEFYKKQAANLANPETQADAVNEAATDEKAESGSKK